MTRVVGIALDDETGLPIAKRSVYATLHPRTVDLPPLQPGAPAVIDETITDNQGRWALELRPTVNTEGHYAIRVWLHETLTVDVPTAGPVDAVDIIIDPGTVVPEPPPNWKPPPYVKVSQLGASNGVATLGPDGILTLGQRPAITGGNAEPSDWFAGDGPPPPTIPGASMGDMYIDRLTGDLYQLD